MSRLRILPFVAGENVSGSFLTPNFAPRSRPNRTSADPAAQHPHFPAVRDPAAHHAGRFHLIHKWPTPLPGGYSVGTLWRNNVRGAIIYPTKADGSRIYNQIPFFVRGVSKRISWRSATTGDRVSVSEPGLFPEYDRHHDYRSDLAPSCPGRLFYRQTFSGALTNTATQHTMEFSGTAEAALDEYGDWQWISYGKSVLKDGSGSVVDERPIVKLSESGITGLFTHSFTLETHTLEYTNPNHGSGSAVATLDTDAVWEWDDFDAAAPGIFANAETILDLGTAGGYSISPLHFAQCVNAHPAASVRTVTYMEIAKFSLGLNSLDDQIPLRISFDLVKRKMKPQAISSYFSGFPDLAPDDGELITTRRIQLEEEMEHPEDVHGSLAPGDPSWAKIGWQAGPLSNIRLYFRANDGPLRVNFGRRTMWKVFVPGSNGPYTVTWTERYTAPGQTAVDTQKEAIAHRSGQVWETPPQLLWVDTTEDGHFREIRNLVVRNKDGGTIRGGYNAPSQVASLVNSVLGADVTGVGLTDGAKGELEGAASDSPRPFGVEVGRIGKIERAGIAVKVRQATGPQGHWGYEDFSQRGGANPIPAISPRKFFRKRRMIYEQTYSPSGTGGSPACGWMFGHLHRRTEVLVSYPPGMTIAGERDRAIYGAQDVNPNVLANFTRLYDINDPVTPVAEWEPSGFSIDPDGPLGLSNNDITSETVQERIVTSPGGLAYLVRDASEPSDMGEIAEINHYDLETTFDETLRGMKTESIYVLAADPGHSWSIENVVIRPAETE